MPALLTPARAISAAAIVLLLTGCTALQESEAVSPAETESESTAAVVEFSVDGIEPCDLIPQATVTAGLGLADATVGVENTRDKDDHKVCRYEFREGNQYSVLILSVNVNDSKDVNPTQYSDRLTEALDSGLKVAGFDTVQSFVPVSDLGTQAAYSGNIPDDKNLIVRIDDDFLIQLEYNKYLDGADIGDYSDRLAGLAHELIG